MGKKFCYTDLKAATQTEPRIKNGNGHRRGSLDSQLERDIGAEQEEDDGDDAMVFGNARNPLQKNNALDSMANGYLQLVHQIEAHLYTPPSLVEVGEKREEGGEIRGSSQTEDEISQSSEDSSQLKIGFVDLFRRSLHFESLGIPLTPLELYSMEFQRSEKQEGRILGGYRPGTKEQKISRETSSSHPSELIKNTYQPPSFTGMNFRSSNPKYMENFQDKSQPDLERERIFEDEDVELSKYAPKFNSRFLESLPDASPIRRLPKRSSSPDLDHCPGSHFKPTTSSLRLPPKKPNPSPIVQEPSQYSIKFSEQTHFPNPIQDSINFLEQSEFLYPVKSQRSTKVPVQNPSKVPGKKDNAERKRHSKCAIQTGRKRSVSPENRKAYSNSCEKSLKMDFRGSREPSDSPKCSRSKKKGTWTKMNVSKLSLNSRWVPYNPESKPNRTKPSNTCPLHGHSSSRQRKPLTLETLLAPRRLRNCSDGELFQNGTHQLNFRGKRTPDPVKSSNLDVFDKHLKGLLKSEPKKSCLKKSSNPVSETECNMVPLHSDTFTDVWKQSRLGREYSQRKQRNGGLYSRADKLRFETIDRLDAGSAGLPLFKDSDQTMERTQYFVSEFDKMSRAERRHDLELRMAQLRWVQCTSDKKYRKHFRKQEIKVKPVDTNSEQFLCPFGHDHCPKVMNATLLGHFVSQHLDDPGVELREIFEDERTLIIFSPKAFELGINTCMSVLVYGGVRDQPCSLPGARFMPTRNINLSKAYAHFDMHLPLFVVICRNRLSSIEGKKVRFDDLEKGDEDVLALWMVSMDLPISVHVLMTILNRRMDITRSSIMKVRGIHKSHNSQEFMHTSKQYMRLTDRDLRVLTNNHTEPIYMEISVKEYAGIYPRHD
ncbi:uncharacterized protein LOC108109641 [Drosophila eugracilis]|uniref:uncharacterized protein LOC108109641 n=1 Tax=Drosophila eugracilis TaxID=29029 RepID=UPI0007E77FFE|nr:uncharacterized protein LOC108109641 [Drosophila eugracilis]